ncbi:MAG: DNA-binding protein WhiA [Clostridia bacterium]
MSFSSKMKSELCRLPNEKECCNKAELAGVICFSGALKGTISDPSFKINTENASVARRVFRLIKWNFGVLTTLNIKGYKTGRNTNSYNLYIRGQENLNNMFKGLGLIKDDEAFKNLLNYRISDELTIQDCCKRAFIRGAFLAGGSVIDPDKTYHLEIVTNHYLLSKDFCRLLECFGLSAKIVLRKSNYVIYFKGSENIVDFLNIIGAHKSLMELENIRIIKEMRNNVNRVINCETANMEKTINASLKQIQGIELIKNTLGLDGLPDNLKEIARIRLEAKEATLKELGEMLHPPVGKSGVNHRLRKLQKIADSLENRKT